MTRIQCMTHIYYYIQVYKTIDYFSLIEIFECSF